MPRRKGSTDRPPKVQRGVALVQALKERIEHEDLLQKDAARILGLSEQHLSAVLTMDRWSGTLSEKTLRSIATFLNIPVISVYMLAEILGEQDFFCENTLEGRLDMVFDRMRKDPLIAGSVPANSDWNQSPISVRVLASILYEQLIQEDLLNRAKLIQISVTDSDGN